MSSMHMESNSVLTVHSHATTISLSHITQPTQQVHCATKFHFH